MKTTKLLLALAACAFALATSADQLESGFARPPEQTKPWCYWYWISDNISKEGITKDLEAMARIGIGEALIGNIYLTPEYGATTAVGKVKVLSPEWWNMVEHAIREGGRTGVNIGLFNCPGWSQSGGPWIKSEQTMRYLASSETHVTGPAQFAQKLPVPGEPFQDVAVLAFPAPEHDADTLAAQSPHITCIPASVDAGRLVDGRLDTSVAFDAGVSFTVKLELAEPFTARSLQLYPADHPFRAEVELQAADRDGAFQTVRHFRFDRSNARTDVGFIAQAPVAISFEPTTAKVFRLLLTKVTPGHHNFTPSQGAALAEIRLSGAARLESFMWRNSSAKWIRRRCRLWGTYLWPTQAEPDAARLAVPVGDVRDLSAKLAADGTLTLGGAAGRVDHPQRTGMTPTGMQQQPGVARRHRGFEVDKLNRKLAQHHFDAFIGEVLKRMPASERKAFTSKSWPTATRWARKIGRIILGNAVPQTLRLRSRSRGCRC
jgi:hypothetical protein